MKEPFWLEESSILIVHGELLNRFGGLDGIRDEGMLDSALNKPLHMFHYGDPTIFELAAAYVTILVKNHPFVDGNKRIGFMAAYIFLGINGYHLQAPEEEAVIMTRDLAAGDSSEKAYAEWLEKSSVRRQ